MSLLWKMLRLAGSSAGSRCIYMLLQLPRPAATAPLVARERSRRLPIHNTHPQEGVRVGRVASRQLLSADANCRRQLTRHTTPPSPPPAPPPNTRDYGSPSSPQRIRVGAAFQRQPQAAGGATAVLAVFVLLSEAPDIGQHDAPYCQVCNGIYILFSSSVQHLECCRRKGWDLTRF